MGKPKYGGVLATPMTWYASESEGHRSLASALVGYELKDPAAVNKANMDQLVERLAALYVHYGIEQSDPNREFQLILRLASDHVEGFKWKEPGARKVGRPTKWDIFKRIELIADVKKIMKDGHSALNACRIIAESPKYKARYAGERKNTLYRRYEEGLSSAGPLVMSLLGPVDADWIIKTYALRENS